MASIPAPLSMPQAGKAGHAAVPRTERWPRGMLALWMFFAGEITIFGGLLASFLLFRHRHPQWAIAAAHTLKYVGALNTAILITSSLTAILAQVATEAKEFGKAARLLGLTAGLGVVFLCVKGFEWTHEIREGLVPTRSGFWSFYYLTTGLHALHLLAGVVALSVVALAVRAGKHPGRVQVASTYWHFVDVVWAFVFPIFYLLSRGSL